MTEAEYNLRLLLYRTGKRLKGGILDEEELVELGEQLIAESQICHWCDGTGEDGDEDGGSYACEVCKGKAVLGADGCT